MAKVDTTELAEVIWNEIEDSLLRLDSTIGKPTKPEGIAAISGCMNSRTGQWRKSRPPSNIPALLWSLVKFHRGNGDLWGWPWFADTDTRDRLDTLAIVLLAGKSNAADAWRKAIA